MPGSTQTKLRFLADETMHKHLFLPAPVVKRFLPLGFNQGTANLTIEVDNRGLLLLINGFYCVKCYFCVASGVLLIYGNYSITHRRYDTFSKS